MRKAAVVIPLALVLVLSFTACEVEQTEEGEMPEVTVEEGNLPEYDVDAPEVDVEMEEKTVEVPDVDIEPAGEDEPEEPVEDDTNY